MRPLVIIIVFTTVFRFSGVRGIGVEHRAAYDRVIECMSTATHSAQPGKHVPFQTIICPAFKAMDACLTKPFDSSSQSSEILDFYRAYQLQRLILIDKSKMCQQEPLPYQKMKELVDKSEIMTKEALPSIENDGYVACAGEINRDCFALSEDNWEQHSNDRLVFLSYVDCYAHELEKTKSCDFPITRHYNTVMQAFKKHMREKHGLFGEMIKKIPH